MEKKQMEEREDVIYDGKSRFVSEVDCLMC